MGLRRYQTMRNFAKTPEPRGRTGARRAGGRFVVQKHDATRLHYDFRLELDGVLKSWAVPKGPSLDPADKRLAVHVEDHPIDYGDFEGVIPKGEYGGGPVIVWDRGTWTPLGDARAGLKKGDFKFHLDGEKLKGRFVLVRMHTADGTDKNWLLMKEKDEFVRRGGPSVVERLPKSVKTGRGIEELVAGKEPEWRSNREPLKGGPGRAPRRKAAAAAPAGAPDAASLPGARRGALPARFVPHPIRAAEKVPEGDAWVHEIALEGRRAVARVAAGKTRLLDASGKDLRSPAFAAVVKAPAAWPARDLLLDGMLCFVDAQGRTSEAGLKDAVSERDPSRVRYFAFDLLHLDGIDLRGVPLVARKEALERLLAVERGAVLLSRHHRGEGSGLLAAACERGLRGMVSKRADGVERPRAKDDWLETLCGGAVPAVEEKAPAAKAKARPARGRPAAGPAISNPAKVLWPDAGVTKRDLVAYYDAVAERMMPLVEGRPLMLLRCPDGHGKPCFVQKHLTGEAPPGLAVVPIEEGGEVRRSIAVERPEGLASLVQMGALEIHGWGSRVKSPEFPDHVVFDFDPAPDVEFARVVDAAEEIRRRLRAVGLVSFVATTGGKGLHVHVPLAAKDGWDEVKAWTRAVAERLEKDHPKDFVAKAAKAARTGRIFVDWLRNGRGATAIVPYSSRARAGATVAVPLTWDELDRRLRPDRFTVKTVPARIASQRSDPWRDYRKTSQRLPR